MIRLDFMDDQDGCQCWHHRYGVVHICECGKLYDHSQGACDAHRQHECINIPSEYYKHGDTAATLFDRMSVLGMLPYGTESFQRVYNYFAENE